jgi:hypothetical protein
MSKAMQGEGPAIPHLDRGEIADLRHDVTEAFDRLESRTGYPMLVGLHEPVVPLGDLPLILHFAGLNLLQGQTIASATLGTGNKALTLTAMLPGYGGNMLSMEIVDSGGGGLAFHTANHKDISIDLGGATPTAAAIVAAFNTHDHEAAGLAYASAGGNGLGNPVVAAKTQLAGGAGSGFSLVLGGSTQTMAYPVQDGSLEVYLETWPLLDGDTAMAYVESNGVPSQPFLVQSSVAHPHLLKMVGAGAGLSVGTLPQDAAIAGTGFTQGQTKATLTSGTGAASLVFTANAPGDPGNDIHVIIAQGVAALSVTVLGKVATITLAANPGGSSAAAVKAAWDLVPAAAQLAQVATSGGGGSKVVAAPEAPLQGGTGDGVEVYVNNVLQAIDGAVTDTLIPVAVSDLTGSAAGDMVEVRVVSNGLLSDNSLTARVIA